MSDFKRVPKSPRHGIDFHPGARFQLVIMFFCELRRFASVARQQIKKAFKSFFVVTEVRRQLPENRAEFFPKRQHAGGEEVCQWRSDISQFFHMRDVTRAFDCENEMIWRR